MRRVLVFDSPTMVETLFCHRLFVWHCGRPRGAESTSRLPSKGHAASGRNRAMFLWTLCNLGISGYTSGKHSRWCQSFTEMSPSGNGTDSKVMCSLHSAILSMMRSQEKGKWKEMGKGTYMNHV